MEWIKNPEAAAENGHDVKMALIPIQLLQDAVNTLARLPYAQVGDLINQLRICEAAPEPKTDRDDE